VDEVTVLLREAVRAGDLVLVKGSRSIGTERVVTALAEGPPEGQGDAA
jgi:UDP-N-acetylmuramoyl-tripeptide--D-alanyl-D-alanine ligase